MKFCFAGNSINQLHILNGFNGLVHIPAGIVHQKAGQCGKEERRSALPLSLNSRACSLLKSSTLVLCSFTSTALHTLLSQVSFSHESLVLGNPHSQSEPPRKRTFQGSSSDKCFYMWSGNPLLPLEPFLHISLVLFATVQ